MAVVTNTFSVNTKIKSAQVNTNFEDVADRVFLGYAEDTTGAQVIGAAADITSLSIEVTVPTNNRRVKITGYVKGTSTDGPRQMNVNILEGATQLQAEAINAYGAGAVMTFHPMVVLTPTAGVHTYKLQANANGGTFTTNAAATLPNFILVEYI